MADIKDTYRIAVVGDELLTKGMKLSGIKYIYNPRDAASTESAIRELVAKPDVGMVIINEDLANSVRDRKLANMIDSGISPVFVLVPGYNQSEKYADTLRKLIIRAVGIDIMAMKK